MNTLDLNSEILHYMSIISNDENLMNRAAKYLRKLVAEKQKDPTEMSREDFCARVEEAKKQIERGECVRFSNREDMNQWLNSL